MWSRKNMERDRSLEKQHTENKAFCVGALTLQPENCDMLDIKVYESDTEMPRSSIQGEYFIGDQVNYGLIEQVKAQRYHEGGQIQLTRVSEELNTYRSTNSDFDELSKQLLQELQSQIQVAKQNLNQEESLTEVNVKFRENFEPLSNQKANRQIQQIETQVSKVIMTTQDQKENQRAIVKNPNSQRQNLMFKEQPQFAVSPRDHLGLYLPLADSTNSYASSEKPNSIWTKESIIKSSYQNNLCIPDLILNSQRNNHQSNPLLTTESNRTPKTNLKLDEEYYEEGPVATQQSYSSQGLSQQESPKIACLEFRSPSNREIKDMERKRRSSSNRYSQLRQIDQENFENFAAEVKGQDTQFPFQMIEDYQLKEYSPPKPEKQVGQNPYSQTKQNPLATVESEAPHESPTPTPQVLEKGLQEHQSQFKSEYQKFQEKQFSRQRQDLRKGEIEFISKEYKSSFNQRYSERDSYEDANADSSSLPKQVQLVQEWNQCTPLQHPLGKYDDSKEKLEDKFEIQSLAAMIPNESETSLLLQSNISNSSKEVTKKQPASTRKFIVSYSKAKDAQKKWQRQESSSTTSKNIEDASPNLSNKQVSSSSKCQDMNKNQTKNVKPFSTKQELETLKIEEQFHNLFAQLNLNPSFNLNGCLHYDSNKSSMNNFLSSSSFVPHSNTSSNFSTFLNLQQQIGQLSQAQPHKREQNSDCINFSNSNLSNAAVTSHMSSDEQILGQNNHEQKFQEKQINKLTQEEQSQDVVKHQYVTFEQTNNPSQQVTRQNSQRASMTFFVPENQNEELSKSIQYVVSNIDMIPERESENAQDLVLALNRCIKLGDPITQEMKAELQILQKSIQGIQEQKEQNLFKALVSKESLNSVQSNSIPENLANINQQREEYIKKTSIVSLCEKSKLEKIVPAILKPYIQNRGIVEDYFFFAKELEESISKISAKSLQSIYSSVAPSQIEQSVIHSSLLISANSDENSQKHIQLSIDRKSLVDKTWSQISSQFLSRSGSGKFLIWLKGAKQAIDLGKVEDRQVQSIKKQTLKEFDRIVQRNRSDTKQSENTEFNNQTGSFINIEGLSEVGLNLFKFLRAAVNYYDFISSFYPQNLKCNQTSHKLKGDENNFKNRINDVIGMKQSNQKKGQTIQKVTNLQANSDLSIISCNQIKGLCSPREMAQSIRNKNQKPQSSHKSHYSERKQIGYDFTSSKFSPREITNTKERSSQISQSSYKNEQDQTLSPNPFQPKKMTQIQERLNLKLNVLLRPKSVKQRTKDGNQSSSRQQLTLVKSQSSTNFQSRKSSAQHNRSEIGQSKHQQDNLSNQKETITFKTRYNVQKFELNNQIYQENIQFEREARAKREEMLKAQRMVTQIKGKEKAIKAQFEKDHKKDLSLQRHQEDLEYINYQHEMRRLFSQFLRKRLHEERQFITTMNKQSADDQRVFRILSSAEQRLKLIDEFRTNLMNSEWQKKQSDLQSKEEIRQRHQDFLEGIECERIYKQQVYDLAQNQEHQERMHQKRLQLHFEEIQLLKQKQEALLSLEAMAKFAKKI